MIIRTVLILSAIAAVCYAQNVIITPRSYHVGTVEQISFTSYNQSQLTVSAILSYRPCYCQSTRYGFTSRKCDYTSDGVKYDIDTATVDQGENVILNVQMPALTDLPGRNYILSVASSDGQYFLKQSTVSFQEESFGFLLVKTDKPIYKPSQAVKFCVVYVDKNLRPIQSNTTIKVIVRDNKYRQIIKWDDIISTQGEFKCEEFLLSDEPSLGQWSIDANIQIPNELGGCRSYYSTPRGSCNFKVQEFVLPKFDISLEGPSQITSKDTYISGLVSGEYVFGEIVRGTVKLNATLMSPGRKDIMFHQHVASLINGIHVFEIPSEKFLVQTRYLFNPFCVKNTMLKVIAEVSEDGRGLKSTKTLMIPLKSDSVSFKFSEDNAKFFRAGLNYTVKAIVEANDGISTGVRARILATINNGAETLHDAIVEASLQENDDEDDFIMTTFLVPLHANCLKITLHPVNVHQSCETDSSVCLAPAPFYSPTRSYLRLNSEQNKLKVGSTAVFHVTSTVPFTMLHYVVIAQGGVVLHNVIDTAKSGVGVKDTDFSFTVSHNMTPRIKVLSLFARFDGELVADLLQLNVLCELEHKVDVSFDKETATPGDAVSIATRSVPESFVLLSVVDSSLHLLSESCKSSSSDNLCRLLGSLTQEGFGNVDTSCSSDSSRLCCPSNCDEPTKYSVTTLFSATGVHISSDMFLPSPPPVIETTRYPYPYYRYEYFFDSLPEYGGIAPPSAPLRPPTEESLTDRISEENEDESTDEDDDTRTHFPESWIWTILKANSSGSAVFPTTTPDTITKWTAEAFALSSSSGVGISPLTYLTVKKLLFVSLELPYSLNWGETVRLVPLIFNFQTGNTTVSISVTVDDKLTILEVPPTSLVVNVRQSAFFHLFLKPRSVGHFPVTISITDTQSGLSDTVSKMLFVKPGCKKHEETSSSFVTGAGRECHSFSPPSCVIPGSASGRISIFGDIMSFSDLDHLLVLPSGCGEQNLVRTAINYVVGKYLTSTQQLKDHIAIKIKNNIQTGYQKELNYLSSSGCFSIWSGQACTSWLTAAVVNYFSAIHNFYEAQEYLDHVVDESVVTAAVNYLLKNQRKTGKFDLIGQSHNHYLLDDKAKITNTAFTIVALKEYKKAYESSSTDTSFITKLNTAITQAESFIYKRFISVSEERFCTYGLSLSVYALHKSPVSSDRLKGLMKKDLQERIQPSKEFTGTCFACDTDISSCSYYARSEKSSVCVETTAYALLALLSADELSESVCLAQWLVRIRNGAGGYYSSQDTIIALEALSKFAEQTFTEDIDLSFEFTIPSITSPPTHIITESNRQEVFNLQIPNIPSSENCVSWSGTGTAILQSTLTYYGCNCEDSSTSFSLELTSELSDENERSTSLFLQIALRYLESGESNMIIIDVEVPSGFEFDNWQYTDERGPEVDRYERRGSSVIFYLNEISTNPVKLTLEMTQNMVVNDYQYSPVTVLDYYDPGKTVTQYYKPETTRIDIPIDREDSTVIPNPTNPPILLPPLTRN